MCVCVCVCVCVRVSFFHFQCTFKTCNFLQSNGSARPSVDMTRSKRRANAKGRYSCQTLGFPAGVAYDWEGSFAGQELSLVFHAEITFGVNSLSRHLFRQNLLPLSRVLCNTGEQYRLAGFVLGCRGLCHWVKGSLN